MQETLIEAVRSAVQMTVYQEKGNGYKIPPAILVRVMQSKIDDTNQTCHETIDLGDIHDMSVVLLELGAHLKRVAASQCPIVQNPWE